MALIVTALCASQSSAKAQVSANDLVVAAKDAARAKDRKRLAAINAQAQAQQHPQASWIDYWELGLRLSEASQPEIDVFYARWPGRYVEDRLRNDWLLELGRRHDWKNFRKDYASFKMRDDREVLCYALLTEHLDGKKVQEAARAAWLAQRDGDEGCKLMADTLTEAKVFGNADAWLKMRRSVEAMRPRATRQAAALLGKPVEQATAELLDNADHYMSRRAGSATRSQAELSTLTLMRVAASDAEQAATLLSKRWERALPPELAAWAWAQTGRQAAFKLQAEAPDHFERALKLHGKGPVDWGDDTLAYGARAALRAGRWPLMLQIVALMSAQEQRDPTWQYWRARALQATALSGAASSPQREEALALLRAIASPLHYYGRLAADELGQGQVLPDAPPPLTAVERTQAQVHPGLTSALGLIARDLRFDGVREWNFSLRGMNDRELMAAAQEACAREIWDRCINTSERSGQEVSIAQRFPMPYRGELLQIAGEAGLDPAFVYGLIRQESRFIVDARSHVGASGLMQVMPDTANWTAKKAGLPFQPEQLNERAVNMRIGSAYLKLVLDDFGGSMAMAAAAYNAGPSRPRRWRNGPKLDAAAWVENIPFHETRDYVKKVLLNTTVYAQVLGLPPGSLRARLGSQIGPREQGTDSLPADARPTGSEAKP